MCRPDMRDTWWQHVGWCRSCLPRADDGQLGACRIRRDPGHSALASKKCASATEARQLFSARSAFLFSSLTPSPSTLCVFSSHTTRDSFSVALLQTLHVRGLRFRNTHPHTQTVPLRQQHQFLPNTRTACLTAAADTAAVAMAAVASRTGTNTATLDMGLTAPRQANTHRTGRTIHTPFIRERHHSRGSWTTLHLLPFFLPNFARSSSSTAAPALPALRVGQTAGGRVLAATA
jgi:hypothetical protein